jgi:hypothetical protein
MEKQFEIKNDNQKKENPAEDEIISQEDFLKGIREIVIKRVSEIYGKNEDELVEQEKEFHNRFVDHLTISIVASMGAGEYFQDMIPNSLNKPKKKYEHEDRFPLILEIEKFIQGKAKDFQKDADFKDINKDFRSKVYADKLDGGIIQKSYNRFVRDDKRIVLEELVENYFYENGNNAHSTLMVNDCHSGLKIDLGQMLPNGYYFTPSEMLKKEQKFNQNESNAGLKFSPVNLNEYKGTKNSAGDFEVIKDASETGNFKKVRYGDISKKGGLISLLHEIGHTWQTVYDGTSNKKNFYEFWDEISTNMHYLRDRREKLKDSIITEDEYKLSVKHIGDETAKLGVKFNPDNFIYQDQNLENGKIIIAYSPDDKYIIECDSFDKIKKGFEKEEREAWAHALLMLRFLRKRGIDLEPEMKNFSDIKDYIEKNLSTYQTYVEGRTKIVGGKISFVK